ncbi:DUF5666 domain-containing protein [Patescibacteria group bacterium]|nr:DUF5666 domain-containing protein [Patescibacteria group bacterium]
MNKNIVLAVVAIIGLALGFGGGMQYQKSRQTSNTVLNGGFRRGNGSGNGFRPVLGSIISADNNSITVKMSDGSSKIVLLAGNTTIGKNTKASQQDLTVGQTVQVIGTNNSDGSVTAQLIQLNPEQRIRPTGTPNLNQ